MSVLVWASSPSAFAEPTAVLEAPAPPTGALLPPTPGLALQTSDDDGVYRPHKWLSHTVRNLNLELADPDLDLGFAFDVADRSARLKLGTFTGSSLGLGIDTDVKFDHGKATLHTTLNLGLAGDRYNVRLPEVSLVPRSLQGQRYIEYQMPVVRGNLDDVLQGLTDPATLLDRLRFF